MAIEKSLYEAPMGLQALAEPEIEIEIENPESVTINGVQIVPEETEEDFGANLAEDMDEKTLAMLAGDLLGEYESDLSSRKEWLDTYVKGLKLLGLKYENRTEPWPGACGVFHPLLMESAVKFQSETIMETFPAMGPVKTLIIGRETPEKKDAAVRVQDDMNYQLTEVMKEYRPEHERMLISMCLSGNAFKKIYFDPSLDRSTAPFIPAEDIVVPYGATNLESAERVTHRMRKTKNEMRKLQVAGFYRDVELGDPLLILDDVEKQKALEQGFNATADNRFQVLEMHCDIDLAGYEDEDEDGHATGIALPYVVTIEKGTQTILAIRRNWLEEDKFKKRRQHFVHYGYIPGFGFYYFGLIHLIGGHAQAATSLLRQLVDAGTLSNLPGGLKSRGLRIKGDDTPIAPGEFRDVDVPSGAIRDNILPLPYKEPSQTLAALMDRIVLDGQKFAATADLNVSDMSSQAPVGTTLAVLERLLKVMSAVQARIHFAMKQEFKLLKAIIRDNTPPEYSYEPEVGSRKAKQSDYDQVDVIPVSDPNAATMAQKVVQYQAAMQMAQGAPQIYDQAYLHRQMLEVLGIKNVDKIVPSQEDMKPVDPVTENMNIMNGKPVKAFQYQDHEAHLGVHITAMRDPKLAQIMGQNPQAQALQAAAMAHIMEHVAFQYRNEIEKQLGATLPPMKMADSNEDNTLPPEFEVHLSQLASQAAAKLLQKHSMEAQAQQNQQAAQDPVLQLQQQELQIKSQEAQAKVQIAQAEVQRKAQEDQAKLQVEMASLQQKTQEAAVEAQLRQAEIERKAKKDYLDAAAKADEIKLREKELQMRTQMEGTRIGVDIKKHQTKVQADQQLQGTKLGVEIAKHREDQKMQKQGVRIDFAKHQAELARQSRQAEKPQNPEGE